MLKWFLIAMLFVVVLCLMVVFWGSLRKLAGRLLVRIKTGGRKEPGAVIGEKTVCTIKSTVAFFRIDCGDTNRFLAINDLESYKKDFAKTIEKKANKKISRFKINSYFNQWVKYDVTGINRVVDFKREVEVSSKGARLGFCLVQSIDVDVALKTKNFFQQEFQAFPLVLFFNIERSYTFDEVKALLIRLVNETGVIPMQVPILQSSQKPYPKRRQRLRDLRALCSNMVGQSIVACGWISAKRRVSKKLIFMILSGVGSEVQLIVNEKNEALLKQVKSLKVGDIVRVEGDVAVKPADQVKTPHDAKNLEIMLTGFDKSELSTDVLWDQGLPLNESDLWGLFNYDFVGVIDLLTLEPVLWGEANSRQVEKYQELSLEIQKAVKKRILSDEGYDLVEQKSEFKDAVAVPSCPVAYFGSTVQTTSIQLLFDGLAERQRVFNHQKQSEYSQPMLFEASSGSLNNQLFSAKVIGFDHDIAEKSLAYIKVNNGMLNAGETVFCLPNGCVHSVGKMWEYTSDGLKRVSSAAEDKVVAIDLYDDVQEGDILCDPGQSVVATNPVDFRYFTVYTCLILDDESSYDELCSALKAIVVDNPLYHLNTNRDALKVYVSCVDESSLNGLLNRLRFVEEDLCFGVERIKVLYKRRLAGVVRQSFKIPYGHKQNEIVVQLEPSEQRGKVVSYLTSKQVSPVLNSALVERFEDTLKTIEIDGCSLSGVKCTIVGGRFSGINNKVFSQKIVDSIDFKDFLQPDNIILTEPIMNVVFADIQNKKDLDHLKKRCARLYAKDMGIKKHTSGFKLTAKVALINVLGGALFSKRSGLRTPAKFTLSHYQPVPSLRAGSIRDVCYSLPLKKSRPLKRQLHQLSFLNEDDVGVSKEGAFFNMSMSKGSNKLINDALSVKGTWYAIECVLGKEENLKKSIVDVFENQSRPISSANIATLEQLTNDTSDVSEMLNSSCGSGCIFLKLTTFDDELYTRVRNMQGVKAIYSVPHADDEKSSVFSQVVEDSGNSVLIFIKNKNSQLLDDGYDVSLTHEGVEHNDKTILKVDSIIVPLGMKRKVLRKKQRGVL
jgi:translation elongation factor EF-G